MVGTEQWRITMLGDGGVGKTALAVQTYDPTIEDAFRHSVVVDDEMTYLEIVDTAGQEEYATLRDQWIREGEGFILVYSIASRRSYDRVRTFQDNITRVKRGARPVFMLIGNKNDKTKEREVSKDEAATLARQWGCPFLETSAKTGHNVERLFMDMVRTLREARNGPRQPAAPGPRPVNPGDRRGPGGRGRRCKVL